MKKTLAALVAIMVLMTACSTAEPEGITLSREAYDELNQAKIERDQLQQEVETLRAQVEALTGQSMVTETAAAGVEGSSSPSGSAGETTPVTETSTGSSTTSTETTSTVETPSVPQEEGEAMNLVRYQDDYGYYGYKNVSGEVIIEAAFDSATEFANGYATVTNGGKIGTVSDRGILTWNTTDTYKKATVSPNNDATEDTDFGKFLATYREALENRDEAYIKAHTHPNVKISFGGHSGWDGLVSYWDLDEGSEGFYKMMKTTLSYGAVDTSGGLGNAYTAPYMFADFPDGYDEALYSVVTGSGVNLRSRPTTESEVLGQATHEVLKVLEEEKDDWVKVQLPDGTRAYIYGQYLWSPLYYRAGFTKVDDTWLLEFFVKGD